MSLSVFDPSLCHFSPFHLLYIAVSLGHVNLFNPKRVSQMWIKFFPIFCNTLGFVMTTGAILGPWMVAPH